MKVAGMGFKSDVTLGALRDALRAAGGHEGLTALATSSEKADTAVFKSLARELNVPIKSISSDLLGQIVTPTQSNRVHAKFGTGSLAEAVALAAAGPGARLISPRVVSQDRSATAAIALGEEA